MKTWLALRAHSWQVASGLALVLAATLLVAGTAIASDDDGSSIDQATQAAWLSDHFRCEHAAQMPATGTVDQAMQATWLSDHFRCEHAAEMPATWTIDPAMQAEWLWDHFCCEHAAEMTEA